MGNSIVDKNHPVVKDYFGLSNLSSVQKHFLISRSYFYDHMEPTDICNIFNISKTTFYNIINKCFQDLMNKVEPFFVAPVLGRRPINRSGDVAQRIIDYRKHNLSVPEIKVRLDGEAQKIDTKTIFSILEHNGFSKMIRRDYESRVADNNNMIEPMIASKSEVCIFEPESFSTDNAGIFIFIPIIKKYGIDELIKNSEFPETLYIPKINSIMSILALKLANIERYSNDNIWCMDRGMGLFSGLNVLPKSAWFSSYSSGVSREMNVKFLQGLNKIWMEAGLTSDTVNLDFTAIPYWGDDEPFENNWSGKRSKALPSILAAIGHDPQTGLIFYGDTTIKHDNENEVVLEFLDFYRQDKKSNLKYLVFDSKFTTYKNLGLLDQQGIKYITIQRKGKKLLEKIKLIPDTDWKLFRIEKSNNKSRTILAYENESIFYQYNGANGNKTMRQIFIKNSINNTPAIIITNDFDIKLDLLIRKYALRWLVEKEISEQIHFFHLNSVSSGIVIKVDFDLVMTILANNLYRLLAMELPGYSHYYPSSIYKNFVQNSGNISISESNIDITLNKKRTLPLLLNTEYAKYDYEYSWLNKFRIKFMSSSTT
jgi:hypothetical protein